MKSLIFLLFVLLQTCNNSNDVSNNEAGNEQPAPIRSQSIPYENEVPVIHVIVALCDNEKQGIVPVSKTLGDGQNPQTNLYWGAAYGVSTYFKRSTNWEYMGKNEAEFPILESLFFEHKETGAILIADAYDGGHIKTAIKDFLAALSGKKKKTLTVAGIDFGLYSNANLLAFIGHNGLMDFELNPAAYSSDSQERDAIILACYSKNYFNPFLHNTRANSLMLTTGLMSPEAYTLHDGIELYLQGKKDEVSIAGAKAYHKYQKCGLNAAKRLLVNK